MFKYSYNNFIFSLVSFNFIDLIFDINDNFNQNNDEFIINLTNKIDKNISDQHTLKNMMLGYLIEV